MFKNGCNKVAAFLMAVAMLVLAWQCSAGVEGFAVQAAESRLERLLDKIPTEVKDLFNGYNF